MRRDWGQLFTYLQQTTCFKGSLICCLICFSVTWHRSCWCLTPTPVIHLSLQLQQAGSWACDIWGMSLQAGATWDCRGVSNPEDKPESSYTQGNSECSPVSQRVPMGLSPITRDSDLHTNLPWMLVLSSLRHFPGPHSCFLESPSKKLPTSKPAFQGLLSEEPRLRQLLHSRKDLGRSLCVGNV